MLTHCNLDKRRKSHTLWQPAAIGLLLISLAACDVDDGTGLERIEFDVEETPLQAFQCFRSSVRVTSFFDDGAVEDATRQADLTSSDPSVVRVSDGNETTPSGASVPKGVLSPVGEPGETATITASLAGSNATLDVVIQAARLQLTPALPVIAEGTQIALRPTAILGDPGNQRIFLANSAVTYTIAEPDAADGETMLGEDDPLLRIDEDGNAIAGDNERPDGASIELTVTASTDTFNAQKTGECEAGVASIPLTVRNETLESLDVGLPLSEVPVNVSQPVTVVGQFTGDHSQNLAALADYRTVDSSGDGDSQVARFGLQGTNVVTSLAGSQGRSTMVRVEFNQTNGQGSAVSAQTPLNVTNESLQSLTVSPADTSILPETALGYTAIGTFADADDNTRQLDLTRDVLWRLRDQATGEMPDPAQVSIGNAPGNQGVVAAQEADVDPVTVLARRTTDPTSDEADGPEASASLSFDAMLASLTITGPDTVGVGQSVQLAATGSTVRGGEQGLTGQVVWRSSDSNITVVSNSPFSSGRLTGIAPGSAEITARYDGVTTLHEVTVQTEPEPDPEPEPEPEPPPVMCTIPNPLPLPLDCLLP